MPHRPGSQSSLDAIQTRLLGTYLLTYLLTLIIYLIYLFDI